MPDNKIDDAVETAAMFAQADMRCTFGPSFFLGHLGRFVREHCPESKENLPLVRVSARETLTAHRWGSARFDGPRSSGPKRSCGQRCCPTAATARRPILDSSGRLCCLF